MDSTVFSMESTLVARVQKHYPDLLFLEDVPLSHHMLKRNGILSSQRTMDALFQPCVFSDQRVFPKMYEMIKLLLSHN